MQTQVGYMNTNEVYCNGPATKCQATSPDAPSNLICVTGLRE